MSERLTKEEIKKIKEVDILTFFKNYRPEDLVRMGRNDSYCLKSHNSVKLSNGLWCQWSKSGVGGRSALDYLIKVEGYEFKEACFYLRDLIKEMPPVKEVSKPRRNTGLLLPRPNNSNSEVFLYLTEERGLDQDLIRDLMARRLIYEEAGSHNAVFLGFNEHNVPAYAFKRGIYSGLKTEAAGSSKTYSFRLEDPESEDLRVFEGAIDLLSFITLSKMNKRDWKNTGYLSLGGVSGEEDIPASLINYLERCPKVRNIYLHFDTDLAGIDAAVSLIKLLEGGFHVENKNVPLYKDVNEHLTEVKKGEVLCTNIW